jgi:DNA-binding transcriptional ArsR family regulator
MDRRLLDFIQSSFASVWSLETLAFLRARPDERFSADDLVRELRGSGPVVELSLATLQAAGLTAAETDGRVRYAPASAELDELAGATVVAFLERPAMVRRLILLGPDEKLKSFSDAFLIRKDPS